MIVRLHVIVVQLLELQCRDEGMVWVLNTNVGGGMQVSVHRSAAAAQDCRRFIW